MGIVSFFNNSSRCQHEANMNERIVKLITTEYNEADSNGLGLVMDFDIGMEVEV